MDYLPIFVALRGQRCVVVGGGEVAQRKVSLLREAGARVRVIAPELCPALRAELRAAQQAAELHAGQHGSEHAPQLEHSARAYEPDDLDGARLVIAATDDHAVNVQVAADAAARGLLVNVVDEPALCTFVMPSIIDRAPVLVAVSTGGASPVLARLTRGALEAALPVRLGALAAFAARHRARVKAALVGVDARRAFWERALQGEPGQLVLAGRDAEAEQSFTRALSDGAPPRRGVVLIGAGQGDPEQLPLAAWRALSGTDLLVHEAELAPELLALARRDAARRSIAVGASLPPAELAHIVERARAGAAVCIVRRGDPYGVPDSADSVALARHELSCVRLRPAPSTERT